MPPVRWRTSFAGTLPRDEANQAGLQSIPAWTTVGGMTTARPNHRKAIIAADRGDDSPALSAG
jgi:hypothetical protein